MKWKCRKPGTRDRALHWWHDWFAWYPVRVPTKGRKSGQKMVWLETVLRKCKWNSTAGIGLPSRGSWNRKYKEKDNDKCMEK